MQSTSSGGTSSITSGGGGGAGAGGVGASAELGRSGGGLGLARFRSAPATWLEALLEDEEDDPLKPNQCLTHLLAVGSPAAAAAVDHGLFDVGPSAGFSRQNSSPAEFLGSLGIGSDGFYSNSFGLSSAKYELPSPSLDVSPTSKSEREVHGQSLFSHMKREESSQIPGGVSSLIDMEMEKLLEDSVPCRVRAKRGCATHPRSIAERVRRTKISDRIRKLQEVVPNMDKQTNTADMLEEAVEYVKFLQRQIQELTEHQRRCKCMVKE